MPDHAELEVETVTRLTRELEIARRENGRLRQELAGLEARLAHRDELLRVYGIRLEPLELVAVRKMPLFERPAT